MVETHVGENERRYIENWEDQLDWLESRSTNELTLWIREYLISGDAWPISISNRDADPGRACAHYLGDAADDLLNRSRSQLADRLATSVADMIVSGAIANEPNTRYVKDLLYMAGWLGATGAQQYLMWHAMEETFKSKDDLHYVLLQAVLGQVPLVDRLPLLIRDIKEPAYTDLCWRGLCELPVSGQFELANKWFPTVVSLAANHKDTVNLTAALSNMSADTALGHDLSLQIVEIQFQQLRQSLRRVLFETLSRVWTIQDLNVDLYEPSSDHRQLLVVGPGGAGPAEVVVPAAWMRLVPWERQLEALEHSVDLSYDRYMEAA